ncbi:MAG TPA: ABC transporter permease [Patescibacteria group bacterium]|nr:ABC transporter permease [Patescibacteria group bacterium]
MSRASSPIRAIGAMTAVEVRLVLRRPENLFVTIVIPTVVLVLFSSIAMLPTGAPRAVDFLLPGAIALGIIATSLVSLSITTAYDRSYGVLKRLGGSPLSRAELIVARLLTVLVVEAVQIALLVATATLALGWTAGPGVSPLIVIAGILVGTAAFVGLGLLIAGTLRAETVLALANVLFLAFLVVGNVIVPIDRLPGPLPDIAAALPGAALADVLRAGLGSMATSESDVARPLILLVAWAIATTILAARTFRWE